MKHIKSRKYLPLLVVALGCLGYGLRWLLYRTAVDEKNLLVAGHPVELALTVVTVGALALIGAAVWRLDGSGAYEHNFQADLSAAIGHILGAVGLLLTVLQTAPATPGYLGRFWYLLGYASPVCLMLAAFARARGKMPYFLLYTVPALFLMFHIVDHYRVWSSNPQLQDYVFDLMGAMVLMFFLVYCACFSAGVGRRRPQLFMGLAAVYLCLTALPATACPYLYAGGMGFAATGLCTLYPRPKPAEQNGESQEKEA